MPFRLERPPLMSALATMAAQFDTLLRELSPTDAARQVPWLTWTVGDTAAHVLTIVGRAIRDRRRSIGTADLADLNARCLQEVPDRDLLLIADRLSADVTTMLSQVFPRIPDDQPVPFHANLTTTILPAAAVILGELVVHGYDIAATCQRDWPIDEQTATLIWCGGAAVLPAWLDGEVAASQETAYRIVLAETGIVTRIELARGQITIEPDDGRRVDAATTVDPVALLLAFPYRRIAAADPIVARLVDLFHPL